MWSKTVLNERVILSLKLSCFMVVFAQKTKKKRMHTLLNQGKYSCLSPYNHAAFHQTPDSIQHGEWEKRWSLKYQCLNRKNLAHKRLFICLITNNTYLSPNLFWQGVCLICIINKYDSAVFPIFFFYKKIQNIEKYNLSLTTKRLICKELFSEKHFFIFLLFM